MREQKLKVSYRATFRQPIGILNRLGAKLTATIPAEIRQKSGFWIACIPGDRTPSGIIPGITGQPTAESAQSQMLMYFAERVSEWEIWTDEGIKRKLERSEYYTRDGQVYAAKETTA